MNLKCIILILVIAVSTSCSVKKRTYRNGYHVDWAFKQKSNNPKLHKEEIAYNSLKEKKRDVNPIDKSRKDNPSPSENNYFASDSKELLKGQIHNETSILFDEPCGDMLIFKNEDVQKVKLLEINEEFVKYKLCDNLDGPIISVYKSKIRSVTYLNGKTEYFDKEVAETKEEKKEPKLVTHDFAIISLVLAGVGVFVIPIIGSIASLIFASMGEKKILAEPKKYEGLDLIKGARIISWIALILWGLLFLFIAALIIALI